jgi:hypothetical protein
MTTQTDFSLPLVAGIYESNIPQYAGFIIREKDLPLTYQGWGGQWNVYARPFNKDGEIPSCYGDDYSHPFRLGDQIGELIEVD